MGLQRTFCESDLVKVSVWGPLLAEDTSQISNLVFVLRVMYDSCVKEFWLIPIQNYLFLVYLALIINFLVLSKKLLVFNNCFSLPSSASANICNVGLMRHNELSEGIDVLDNNGNVVGSSKVAARHVSSFFTSAHLTELNGFILFFFLSC